MSLIRATLVAVLALAILACSGGGEESSADETTATSDGRESVEDQVVDRYLAFWDARFAANSPPNPDHPDLREYATGELLRHVTEEARSNRDAGVEFRRPDEPADFRRVEVVTLEGDRATVQDCRIDDGRVVRQNDGAVVNDAVATQSLLGELERVDGEWRVALSTLVQRWDGVAGCALAE